ncbi:MAG: radical SAM protein [Ruminococcus sp.]|nr:radical SAM protein [Ruminococcus sp.]
MQTLINGYDISRCMLCPRACGADRTRTEGFCGGGSEIRAARSALHHWEEPCISGTRGSGTIFFSGCSLRCCFCQNASISTGRFGASLSISQLAECMLHLQEQGAHNINLVTGSHYTPWIIEAIHSIRDKLHIPLVWNSSGYESSETLSQLDGMVDIYLPDFKYLHKETSKGYAQAEDYPEIAKAALREMLRQAGTPVFNADGILQKGLIVRHLVLPGHRHESMALLDTLSELLPKEAFLLSLMGQYTPPEMRLPYKNLNRRLTTMEYRSVLRHAQELGFDGFSQDLSSAQSQYTPNFNLEGIPNDTDNNQ